MLDLLQETRRPDLVTRALADVRKIRERRRDDLIQLGSKLERVRRSRAYTEKYATFSDFCHTELGMTETRANQIIRAADLANRLIEATGSSPRSERQLRDLYNEANNLDWKGTVQAWRIAVKIGGDFPKAQHLKLGIEEARRIMIAERRPVPERRRTNGIGRADALHARRAYEEAARGGPPKTLAEKAEASRRAFKPDRKSHKVRVEPPTPLLDRVAEYHGFDDLEQMLADFVASGG